MGVVDASNGLFTLVEVGTEDELLEGVHDDTFVAGGLSAMPFFDDNDNRAYNFFEGGPMNMRTMFMNNIAATDTGNVKTADLLSDVVNLAVSRIIGTTEIDELTKNLNYGILRAHTCTRDDYTPISPENIPDTDLLKTVISTGVLRIAAQNANWGVSGTYSDAADDAKYGPNTPGFPT